MAANEKNASGQLSPGLSCPECGHHIPTTIEMLLNNSAVFCSNCGLELSIDREESKAGLDQLRKLSAELKKADKAKQSPYS